MTRTEAHKILTEKYPKTKINFNDIGISPILVDGYPQEFIEHWGDACEHNSNGTECVDWFNLDGTHKSHKCK